MAWHPTHHGLLATGGGHDDQIIRLWEIDEQSKAARSPQELKNYGKGILVHAVKCTSGVTSLSWHDFSDPISTVGQDSYNQFCSELVSTHSGPDNEIKLW